MDRSLEHPRDSKEALLAAFAGILPVIPNASGQRETLYLAKIQGQDVQLPETDRTRTEMYLRAIAEHGGGGGSVTSHGFFGNGDDSIVVPELIGKTLIACVFADTLSPSELSESGQIAFSLSHTSVSGHPYSTIAFPSGMGATFIIGGYFFSDTGEIGFNAILPRGKLYVAFYQ